MEAGKVGILQADATELDATGGRLVGSGTGLEALAATCESALTELASACGMSEVDPMLTAPVGALIEAITAAAAGAASLFTQLGGSVQLTGQQVSGTGQRLSQADTL